MGQTYDVNLVVLFKDKEKATTALQDYVTKEMERGVRFGGDKTDTFDDCMELILAKHQGMYEKTERKQYDVYTSNFDASYGWESILAEMFNVMKPYLAGGSSLTVYPDGEPWKEAV